MSMEKHEGNCSKTDFDFERLNYYYGQMMVERDFRDQQRYYNEKRWSINRFGIGWGVLHGLEVRIVKNTSGNEGKAVVVPDIMIEPGFALDLYGNEILVSTVHTLNIAKLLNDNLQDKGPANEEHGNYSPVYIAVRYRECGAEPFRLPDTHCCDVENDCTYSRTRETQEFIVSRTPWHHDEDNEKHEDKKGGIDNLRSLLNPAAELIGDHPKRIQCRPVPLATLLFVKGRWIVDNFRDRQIAYSNYRLAELVECLTSELRKCYAAGYDRRSFVPLLAQTIPGLKYRSGRTKLYENFGELPFRITTDGRYIWCTDLQLNIVHHLPIDSGLDNPVPQIGLSSNGPGWGISFDGHAVWVTIPAENKVERINIHTLEKQPYSLNVSNDSHSDHDDRKEHHEEHNEHHNEHSNNPREIVFDGQYLWISHGPYLRSGEGMRFEEIEHERQAFRQSEKENGNMPPHERVHRLDFSRLDPFDGSIRQFSIDTNDNVTPVSGMVFDGRSLWIAYNDSHYRAVARRIRIIPFAPNQISNEQEWHVDEPIELRGDGARDIAFDGNAVWVTHDEGASKIDSLEYREVAVTGERGRLSSIVFDGRMMWMVQNRENESELRQCNLISLHNHGGYELHNGEGGLHIGRMCFDGSYLWVTGNKINTEIGKGIIYRILP